MTVGTAPHGLAASLTEFDDSSAPAVPLLPAHSPYADALVEAVQRQDVRAVLAALRYLHVKGLLFPTLGKTGVDAKHSRYGISAVEWQMRQPESPASRVILDLLFLNLDGVRAWHPSEDTGIRSVPIQAWARVALQALQRAKGRNAVVAQSLLYATSDGEVHDILRVNGIEQPSSRPRDDIGPASTPMQAPATYAARYSPAKPTPRYQESFVRGNVTDVQQQILSGDAASRSARPTTQGTSPVAFPMGPDLVDAQQSDNPPRAAPKREEPEEGELLPSEPPIASATSSASVASLTAQLLKVHPSRLANLGLDPAATRFRTDPYPTPSLSPSPPPPVPAQPASFYESRKHGRPLASDQQEAYATSRVEETRHAVASSATGSGQPQAQAGPSEPHSIDRPPPEKKQRTRNDADQAPTNGRKSRSGKGRKRVSGRKVRSKTTTPEGSPTLSTPSAPPGARESSHIPFSLSPRSGSFFSSTRPGTNVVPLLGLGWAPPAPAPTSVPLSPEPKPLHMKGPRRARSCLGKRRRTSGGSEPVRKLTVRWRDDQLEDVLGFRAGHVEEVYCDADEEVEELREGDLEDEVLVTDTEEEEEDAILGELLEQEFIAQAGSTLEIAPNESDHASSTPVLPSQEASAIPSAWTW